MNEKQYNTRKASSIYILERILYFVILFAVKTLKLTDLYTYLQYNIEER